jgi:transcriptional antiterminator RfaH
MKHNVSGDPENSIPDTTVTLKWYPVYTCPRAEKRVFQRLSDSGVEAFLPTQKTLKQWCDRKKWVEEPLFPSYLFVRIDFSEHIKVLQVNGIVRFIFFGGKPAFIRNDQIELIRKLISGKDNFEITQSPFEIGEKVEIITGPFRGNKAELTSWKGKRCLVVRIEVINYNLLLDVEPGMIRKVTKFD